MAIRILITGGSGFIGTNLVEDQIARGNELLTLDFRPPRVQRHAAYWKDVDLRNESALKSVVRDFEPTHIVHLGARTDLNGRSQEDYAPNTLGLANFTNALLPLRSLTRVIFASSRLVCRIGYQPKHDADYCPTTLYGESKVIGEKLVRDASALIPADWMIIRPTSIWGPWFGVPYCDFFLAVVRGRYFHPGAQPVYKSFGFVRNTVHQISRLLVAPAEHVHQKTFYLADYPPVEVRAFANAIRAEIGEAPVGTLDPRWLGLFARVGDLAKHCGWAEPPLTSFRLSNLVTDMVYDLNPLEQIVGTLPYTMQEGVASTVEWLRNQRLVSQ